MSTRLVSFALLIVAAFILVTFAIWLVDMLNQSVGCSGLMSLVMPHLSQVVLLNFAAFVGLALLFLVVTRLRSRLRAWIDVLLVLISAATLFTRNAMGRSNMYSTGAVALLSELALIVFALADLIFTMVRSEQQNYWMAIALAGEPAAARTLSGQSLPGSTSAELPVVGTALWSESARSSGAQSLESRARGRLAHAVVRPAQVGASALA